MSATAHSISELLRQWRRQLVSHCNPGTVAARKGFFATTFLDQSKSTSVFVEINNLLTVVVYEDDSRRNHHSALRFAAYDVNRVDNGVRWGGDENCRLFKDLTLAPRRRACGQRMDLSKVELLSLALRLDCRLSRAARHPAAPWPELKLPRLWAGFRSSAASCVSGNGPEFEEECALQSIPSSATFRESARYFDGLTLYPLDWISDQLTLAAAVFAEVTPTLRRQVCRIGEFPEGLIGYRSASEFDFYNSRYRKVNGRHRRHSGPRGTGHSTSTNSRTKPLNKKLVNCA